MQPRMEQRWSTESGDKVKVDGWLAGQSRAQAPSFYDLRQASPTLSLKKFLAKMGIIMPATQSDTCLIHRRAH